MQKRYEEVVRASTIDGRLLKTRRCVVTCCGEELWCEGFTSTCPCCGADYNSAGQLLAPRSQWGEETGETWSDCYEGSLED